VGEAVEMIVTVASGTSLVADELLVEAAKVVDDVDVALEVEELSAEE